MLEEHERGPSSIAALIARMQDLLDSFPPADPRRHFHSVYLRTTQAVAQEIGSAELGGFLDPEWVERWDVAFASLYLDALGAWSRAPATTPGRGRWRSARLRNGPTTPRCATSCSASTRT